MKAEGRVRIWSADLGCLMLAAGLLNLLFLISRDRGYIWEAFQRYV